MNVLVLNAGSSSLKYQLVNTVTESVLAIGLCEKVGAADSFHKFSMGETENVVEIHMEDHHAAVQEALNAITAQDGGVISNLDEIDAVGHRVVHGGEYFSVSVLITDDVIDRIDECSSLAPLHNPAALMGIRACKDLLGAKPQVAVFDTSFHQTIPAKSFMYALPYDLYEEHRIRRYGFHGTSHRYVSQRAAKMCGRDISELKLITCHLGNGCSITAIENGRSIDTSMGFTPLEGLMMGTRCGSIDPAIVTHLIQELGKDPAEVNAIMNKQSGLLGISGLSNDLRDVQTAADEGNQRAVLANEMYANNVKKVIGSYVFEMCGVDAIVLAGGVGENSHRMRSLVFEGLGDLGIVLDAEANLARGLERCISSPDSKVKVFVIPTNEELMIAKDVSSLVA